MTNAGIDTNGSSEENWTPIVGPETQKFLEYIANRYKGDESSKTQLLSEAIRILSRCVPPSMHQGSETGLVIGYVQSGKTTSFTTLTTLARDNQYPLIVIITGTSTTLTDQSIKRLRTDLQIDTRPDRPWWFRTNPREDDSLREIQDCLEDWEDATTPRELRQTVLITVMKHHTHLRHLIDVLSKLELDKVPCLIIDDEGDQASLNTKAGTGDESTTYSRILELRSKIKHCSYLQYTATPQAPLLINIIDILSPRFAEILEPGSEYVGGEEFFNKQTGILSRIPENEIFTHRNMPNEPPNSLLKALRTFFVTVSIGSIVDNEYGHRTMMIHPSHRTMPHAVVKSWVNSVKDMYLEILGLDSQDPDRSDLIEDFRGAYVDLCRTVDDLPSFEEIIGRLKRSIRKTVVQEVNAASGKTRSVDWGNSYAHILVGGQSMDRGVTVEGLIVTYMPRGLGVGNADTVQQRARFFGYKKSYLSMCRIFMGDKLYNAYVQYVNHEKSIRSELVDFQESGRSLDEWRRVFLMPTSLRPTRSNVVEVDYMRGTYSDQWFIPIWPHFSEEAIQSNSIVTKQFIERLNLIPDPGHDSRTDFQRHLYDENVSLSEAHQYLLTALKMADRSFAGVLLQIRNIIEDDNQASCTLYKMSSNEETWFSRKRGLNATGRIAELMQGRNPNQHKRVYSGDRYIGDKNRVIIQIHKLDLESNQKPIAYGVINIAIWIPKALAIPWLAQ